SDGRGRRRPKQRCSRGRRALPASVECARGAGRRRMGARFPRLLQRVDLHARFGIDPHHADTEGRVDATRSLELLGTFDAPAVVDGDTVIVPFTEADTVQKYFPGHEVYTDLFFHGTHTAATVSSNAVRIAGITSGTKLVAV